MSVLSILLTAIGLSMDAFAVSITIGLNVPKEKRNMLAIKAATYFGLFQGIMPFIGWILGVKFTKYIEAFDHWIAFILLSIIGGKMIIEAIKGDEEEQIDIETNKRFLILAIATSIDALAVGVSFAVLKINILYPVCIIAIVTFILSYIAVYLGKTLSRFLKNKAEILGGTILIIIGFKILLEHLKIF